MTMLRLSEIEDRDQQWLQQEAARRRLSMEALVRRLIREKRQEALRLTKPSEIVRQHFGPEHGVDLGGRARFGFEAANPEDPEAS